MRSWKKPTPEQVAKAVAALSRPEAPAFFFGKLDNPLWIEPLLKHGYFKTPPPAVREQDRVSFPVWPAALYLVRMAAYGKEHAQAAVAAALAASPTDNHIVHVAYADLVLASPPDVAVPLAKKEREWIAGEPWLFALLPQKYGEVASHLAIGGQMQEAVALAKALLAVHASANDRAVDRVVARFDTWHYREVLKRVIPAVQQANALSAVRLAGDLLFDYVKDQSDHESIGRRPAIEQSGQNWNRDSIPDLLIEQTRDVCEAVVRSGDASLETVVGELAKRREQGVFKRLELHLVRVFKDQATSLVEKELLDTAQLHSITVRHEYALLMRDAFGLLSEDQKSVILQAITDGPPSGKWELSNPEERAKFENYSRRWKLDRLAVIRDSLPPDWRAVYEGLVEELGEPAHPEFDYYHQSAIWHGPQSPKSADELAGMSLDALVEYLVVWRPVRDFMAPSPEGLGRTLSDAVLKDPARFVQQHRKLHRLHPEYVRSIVSGLATALKQNSSIDTTCLLDFMMWCVSQSAIPYALKGEFTDKDWGWTRRAILDVLTAGMQGKTEFPISARDQVWRALAPTLEDPNPARHEEETDSQGIEPFDLALNTVRGAAMLALIQYALWVRRAQERAPDAARLCAAGFDEMPEVRDALNAHLDAAREPSLAVRSVYGRWFPWLTMLDKKWAEGAVPRIFPEAPEEQEFRDASWLTYVVYNSPYRDVIGLLRDQYRIAAGRLGTASKVRVRALETPEQALGHHLLVMYARGWIEIDDPALVLFFDRADVETRVDVLATVGRDLGGRDDDDGEQEERKDAHAEVPAEVLARLKAFWDSRMANAARDKRELAAFGWWFACGAFDDEWTWPRLVLSTQEVDHLEGLLFVAKRLALVGPAAPGHAIRVLKALIANSKEPWSIYELKDAVRPVAAAALQADDEARQAATYVLNRLGERGFTEYGDLLTTK